MKKDEEEEFLKKHFKAGEYAVVTVMVRLNEMDNFLTFMQGAGKAGLNLAMIPRVKAELEFEADGSKTDKQQPNS